MTRQQIIKMLKVFIIMTSLMLLFELIFLIPEVNTFFIKWLDGKSGWTFYLIVWILMFLQCNILNIPAITILEVSILAGVETISVIYILVVMSAYMAGCITSYFIGAKFGTKAVKWIAGSEEDFNKWSKVINNKGKWWYFATVIFPLFPDDLLCIVAGSLKFNFGFYCFANAVGRCAGLITTLFILKLVGMVGGNFPLMVLVWTIGLIVEVILYFVLKKKEKNNGNN